MVAGALMNEPLVSVILCTYQQADFVMEAVQSVLDQEYEQVELVVVDNGSTDDTADLLAEIDDERVRVLRGRENLPVTRRLNEGIDASRGSLVSILYGDDLYLPAKLAAQVELFRDAPVELGVVYGPGIRRNLLTGEEWEDASITGSGDVLVELLRARGQGRFINPISPLVRRACFDRHRFYEDIFVEGENHYYRIATTHRFRYQTEPLVIMREHDRNMGKVVRKNWVLLDEVLRRLERAENLPPGSAIEVRRARADLHRTVAWIALRVAEDPVWARQCLRGVATTSPAQLLRPKALATGVLALLPGRQLHALNQLGFRLRQPREVVAIHDRY